MRNSFIEEPLLQFGKGTHICPRAGISAHGVFDIGSNLKKSAITLGLTGTSSSLITAKKWLDRCQAFISAKASKQPNLFSSFCGFNEDIGFMCKWIVDDELTRSINASEVKRVSDIASWNDKISAAVELFVQEITNLAHNKNPDVIICVIPQLFEERLIKQEEIVEEETLEEEDEVEIEFDFRRALKAKTMHLAVPLQLIKESNLRSRRGSQDDATKAWNFCTAIYYKENGTPWRLMKAEDKPASCYVGISFYRSRDKQSVQTSLAQMFDELGKGVILRGSTVETDKDDRRPHLSKDQANDLLARALAEYRKDMKNYPGRLVIHKTSKFSDDEMEGFKQVIQTNQISATDYVTIMDSHVRILRDGLYPPYRGTHIELAEDRHLLYTRGSVQYFETYPGQYIPQPIEVRIVENDESPDLICEEILALTKMNWNNTQFDGKYPITIGCARRVGQIMKYIDEKTDPQTRYSFYI